MESLDELGRIRDWTQFMRKTDCLAGVRNVVEVGPGISKRVQLALLASFYRGTYTSLDKQPIGGTRFLLSSFNYRGVTTNFFDFQERHDLVVFDHSIDDILAYMIDNGENGNNYTRVMDRIKDFNYEQENFLRHTAAVLNHAKQLLSPSGRIAISNWPTEFDIPRGTIETMEELLPYLAREAKKIKLSAEFRSDRFLLLNNYQP